MARVENVEENKVKVYFEVSGERFEEGLQYSYNKNKGDIVVPGFRKGRVPRKIIEMNFGKEVFYDDAFNFVLPDAYEGAIKELGLAVVSRPEIDVEEANKETGAHFTAEVYVKPGVTIENYRGLTYKPYSPEVTDEEIEKEISTVQEKNSRVISVDDRTVENGDITTIDFEGFIDGVAFEGGKGEDYQLTIGTHTFIDNFEEQLIGCKTGDAIDVNVSFPEDYGQKDLAGKPALFKVAIKGIQVKELPVVDDEFAQDVSEFDTLEEYKKDIEAKLKKEKEADALASKENQLMDAIIENAAMNVPEIMFENEIDRSVDQFARRLSYQGMGLETYLHYAGQTMDSLRKMYRASAEQQVKGRLALEAIAEKEGIEVSDEQLDEEIKKMAEMNQMEFDKLKESIHEEEQIGIKEDIKVREALKIVMDSATEVAGEDEEASS